MPLPVLEKGIKPGYHIMTWGCQMNEEDSEQMGLFLEQMGYESVQNPETAEVVLLNTCSVRAKPEEKVWSMLGKLRDIKRTRPELIIGVCGCMAQVESDEIRRRAPHVDMVVGTGNIASIPDLVRSVKMQSPEERGIRAISPSPKSHNPNYITLTSLALPERKGAVVTDIPLRTTLRARKLKAHVPIMYGCDKFCTFCIVPLTRGRERSRPTVEIIDEIKALAAAGTKEVTLLGQTVNSYGKNMLEGRVPFCDLLQQIDAIRGIERIRFVSPYPRDFTDDLIQAIGTLPSVCEYVHLPLQVGDNDLLLDMHRGYTVERYFEIVDSLRKNVPGIAISTDIMLGYPGETDIQYANTMNIVEAIRFDAAYMFAYSPRPNTKAAAREDQIPHEVKMERLSGLIELQNRITCEINESQVGQVFEVLVEGYSPKDSSKLTGYSRTFKTMNFPISRNHAEIHIGKLVEVKAVSAHLWGFTGELVSEA